MKRKTAARRPSRFLGVLLTLSLAAACVDSGGLDSTCQDMVGEVLGRSVPILDGGSLVGFSVENARVTGLIQGGASAAFEIERVARDGTLHLVGSHTFVDAEDAFLFRTDDRGLTTTDGKVENAMTIVEGASGSLVTQGTVDLQTGAVELVYSGEVCR